jgi:hypothetical protein
MRRRALVALPLALALSAVEGYGEGLFGIEPASSTGGTADAAWTLAFVAGADNGAGLGHPHCRRHPPSAGPLEVRLRGSLPGARVGAWLCADVWVRTDDSRNWWYLVPPAPTKDDSVRACGNVTSSRAEGALPVLDIPLQLSLAVGYSLLSAELRDRDGTAGQSALAHAAVWAAGQRSGELASELALLKDAHEVVRKDEREDRTERRRIIATNAARYEEAGLRRHPHLQLKGSGQPLRDLLDPSLAAALKLNSAAGKKLSFLRRE